MQQTLRAGFRAGLVLGLAVALGDATLGGVAALGADVIRDLPAWVRRTSAAVAALSLFWLGFRACRRARGRRTPARRPAWRAAGGALVLALSTPGTLPALIVLFAAMRIQRPAQAVAGVFVGGGLWWLTLCGMTHLGRDRALRAARAIDYACVALLWLGAGAAAHVALTS